MWKGSVAAPLRPTPVRAVSTGALRHSTEWMHDEATDSALRVHLICAPVQWERQPYHAGSVQRALVVATTLGTGAFGGAELLTSLVRLSRLSDASRATLLLRARRSGVSTVHRLESALRREVLAAASEVAPDGDAHEMHPPGGHETIVVVV